MEGVPGDAFEDLLAAIAVAEQVMPFGPVSAPVPFASGGAGVVEVGDEARHGGHAEGFQFPGGVGFLFLVFVRQLAECAQDKALAGV